jgi:hypothetical protein
MSFRTFGFTLLFGLLYGVGHAPAAFAQVDQIMPPIGGPGGGQFFSRCPDGTVLAGFNLNVGDDVDAAGAVCRGVLSTNIAGGNFGLERFGGTGGGPYDLSCPGTAPAVVGIDVGYEGVNTVVVNNIHVFCGAPMTNGPLTTYPTRVFDGAAIGRADNGPLQGTRPIPLNWGRAVCPAGLVAVGITGRSGRMLDALSLICGPPPRKVPSLMDGLQQQQPQRSPITSIGRLHPGTPAQPNPDVHTICDAARDALARKSPVASNLVTQCQGQGGYAAAGPSNADLAKMQVRGEVLASADKSATIMRDRTPEPDRRGFDIGLGVWEGNTAPGPGKQRYHDALIRAEQHGFEYAAAYAYPRNKFDALVKVGLAIDAADAEVHTARGLEPDPVYWLGFDIASGLFGDPAAGSKGNKALDASAIEIRNSLNAAGQRGFNSSTKLHLSRSYP